MKLKRLNFGTDGVRAVANTELSVEFALYLGQVWGQLLKEIYSDIPEEELPLSVVVGCDTRISGSMLAQAFASGLNSMGVNAIQTGVLPTPAVAYLTSYWGAQGGAMITASHNPVPDNGIKLFDERGHKLTGELLVALEKNLATYSLPIEERVSGTQVGRTTLRHEVALELYQKFLVGLAPRSLEGMRIVLDLAHGSATTVAVRIFEDLGAEVMLLHSQPNGAKINVKCGATHLKSLCSKVQRKGADMGFAFDGDADRCLAVDEDGNPVDGDQILKLLALYMKDKDLLERDTVVATVMSNAGLEVELAKSGIELVRTAVGDRYVFEEMLRDGYSLGGEQSGHILCLPFSYYGDGILTALLIAAACQYEGKPLSDLAALEKFPQKMKNIVVEDKSEAMMDDELQESLGQVNKMLGDKGRALLRPSGTESLIRVMVECRDEELLDKALDTLVVATRNTQN